MHTTTVRSPRAFGPARKSFIRRNLPYLLIAPSVVMLLALIAYPLLFALRSSFYFWNLQIGPEPLQFVGFENYVQAFNAFDFRAALTNTLILSILGTALEFIFGLAIALILLKALPGMNIVRALLILPTTIAPIVVGFLFRYLYDPGGGLLSWLLQSLWLPFPQREFLARHRQHSRPSSSSTSGSGRRSLQSFSMRAFWPCPTRFWRPHAWIARLHGRS